MLGVEMDDVEVAERVVLRPDDVTPLQQQGIVPHVDRVGNEAGPEGIFGFDWVVPHDQMANATIGINNLSPGLIVV